MTEPYRFARCVAFLKDGRRIDLSGCTAAEAHARLLAARVTYDDVRETLTELVSREQVHAAAELERRTVQ